MKTISSILSLFNFFFHSWKNLSSEFKALCARSIFLAYEVQVAALLSAFMASVVFGSSWLSLKKMLKRSGLKIDPCGSVFTIKHMEREPSIAICAFLSCRKFRNKRTSWKGNREHIVCIYVRSARLYQRLSLNPG